MKVWRSGRACIRVQIDDAIGKGGLVEPCRHRGVAASRLCGRAAPAHAGSNRSMLVILCRHPVSLMWPLSWLS